MTDDSEFETPIMRDLSKVAWEVSKAVLIISCVILGGFIIFIFGGGVVDYVKYDVLDEERPVYATAVTPSPSREKPVELYATFTICESPSKCFDTYDRLEDGIFHLTAENSKMSFNTGYFIKTSNGTFLPAVNNFCSGNVCFERNNDIIYLKVSAGNQKTFLDAKGTVFINDYIVHSPSYLDVDKDGFTEFVYPIDISKYLKSDDYASLNFRILGIYADDKHFINSVNEDNK